MIVDILKLDNFGRGITYINNKICFVENALENETVKIKVIKETSKYIEAKKVEVIKESPYRIKSKCIYSNICGGCNLEELNYKKENEYKENKVKELVNKVLKKDISIVKDIVYDKEYNYRNKVILHSKNNQIGLYKTSTHEIVEIESCQLLSKKINEMIKVIKEYKNLDEILIRSSNDDKKILLSVKSNNNEIINLKDKCNVLKINNQVLTQNESIITNIKDKKYYVSADSFFQINNTLTEKLYDEVNSIVEKIKPKNVLDLYCGTGSIGIYISNSCDNVIGIDYNESNIKDAIKNKELNKVNNINFICSKVEDKINEFNNIDLIIVDPPRNGLDTKTKDNLKRINSKTIIYVSCDLNTLIRDIKDLETNYEVEYIKPFNMFPKTYHVECVCLLKKPN